MNWPAWSIDRVLIVFDAAAFLLIGIQAALFHYRQNFIRKTMWIPVVGAPVFFAAGLILAWYNAPWLRALFAVLMWLAVAEGLAGFYLHFRGVGVRVGGWALRNFLIGPPVVLPLMYAALGVLGLIAVYLKGE